jgi:tetratricopeptide (TPR) repeat protein
VTFVDTPTPLPTAPQLRTATGEGVGGGRPTANRGVNPDTDPLRGFAEQRTPGFGEQRTDQRTPTADRIPPDQRTPTDPAFSRVATGTPTGAPLTGRVSTDNAAAAEAAFKRGEAAMKRDQPGDAILEFKSACDLNPSDLDYAGMLAWAKFCAAGDKPGIGADTRKALERAVFKSHRPERARFYLGRVERMLGRDKEALRHFQEVLDLKPNHAEAASEIRAIEARLAAANKSGGLFSRKR